MSVEGAVVHTYCVEVIVRMLCNAQPGISIRAHAEAESLRDEYFAIRPGTFRSFATRDTHDTFFTQTCVRIYRPLCSTVRARTNETLSSARDIRAACHQLLDCCCCCCCKLNGTTEYARKIPTRAEMWPLVIIDFLTNVYTGTGSDEWEHEMSERSSVHVKFSSLRLIHAKCEIFSLQLVARARAIRYICKLRAFRAKWNVLRGKFKSLLLLLL